jgi:hypothetical protein
MRFPALLAAAILGAAGSTFAQPLTQGERDFAMSALHASRKSLNDAVAGLSAKQLSYKAAPDRWSVAEVVEHLAETEVFLFELSTKKALGFPADPSKQELVKGKDKDVMAQFASRATKVEAPPPVRPTARYANFAATLAAFEQRRAATIQYVEKSPDPLRLHFIDFGGNPIDAYQILLGIAGHTDRHVDQIREIRNTPGFPKR